MDIPSLRDEIPMWTLESDDKVCILLMFAPHFPLIPFFFSAHRVSPVFFG